MIADSDSTAAPAQVTTKLIQSHTDCRSFGSEGLGQYSNEIQQPRHSRKIAPDTKTTSDRHETTCSLSATRSHRNAQRAVSTSYNNRGNRANYRRSDQPLVEHWWTDPRTPHSGDPSLTDKIAQSQDQTLRFGHRL